MRPDLPDQILTPAGNGNVFLGFPREQDIHGFRIRSQRAPETGRVRQVRDGAGVLELQHFGQGWMVDQVEVDLLALPADTTGCCFAMSRIEKLVQGGDARTELFKGGDVDFDVRVGEELVGDGDLGLRLAVFRIREEQHAFRGVC